MKTKSFILAAGAVLLLSAASIHGAQADNGHHRCGGNSGKGVGNECAAKVETHAEHRAALRAEIAQNKERRREAAAAKRAAAEQKKAAHHARREEERKASEERRAARRHHDVTPVTTGATVTTTTTTGK